MVHHTGGLGFVEEACLGARLVEEVAMQNLHRHGLADVDVRGAVDNAARAPQIEGKPTRSTNLAQDSSPLWLTGGQPPFILPGHAP